MLTKVVRYGVALNYISHNFNRKRNILIHHGLMGSCKNFRTISKSKTFSDYFNSYMIDARNHGDSPHTKTHTISELADDLYQFIVAQSLLDPDCRLTLMGHSMGGMALMEFTKRYYEPEIQSLIDRVIIIDIPAVSINEIDPINSTGTMLKRMTEIDLSLPLAEIYHQIDRKALRKDIAGLLKGDIIKSESGGYKWRPNINLLANKAYENISSFALVDNNPKDWKKPVELIYGEFSGMFDEKQKKQYCRIYPQMTDENFHQIDKSGHWVHFQNTQHFLQTSKKIFERDQPQH